MKLFSSKAETTATTTSTTKLTLKERVTGATSAIKAKARKPETKTTSSASATNRPRKIEPKKRGLEVSLKWNGNELFHAKASTVAKVAKATKH